MSCRHSVGICTSREGAHEPCEGRGQGLHLQGSAADESENSKVREKAAASAAVLSRSCANGPRKTLPAPEEIDAALCGQLMKAAVFFLDGNFQELRYDPTTTVGEAVAQLAAKIGLQNYGAHPPHYGEENIGQCRPRSAKIGQDRPADLPCTHLQCTVQLARCCAVRQCRHCRPAGCRAAAR
jgi:hypothetical protein